MLIVSAHHYQKSKQCFHCLSTRFYYTGQSSCSIVTGGSEHSVLWGFAVCVDGQTHMQSDPEFSLGFGAADHSTSQHCQEWCRWMAHVVGVCLYFQTRKEPSFCCSSSSASCLCVHSKKKTPASKWETRLKPSHNN